MKLGSFVHVSGADVGVRAPTVSSFGSQLVVGEHASVDAGGSLIAPSIFLGSKATVGDIETNTLVNGGARAGAQTSFPSSMPSLPLAGKGQTGKSLTLAPNESASLTPGNYGTITLADHASLHLAPGAYSFASLAAGEHSNVDASGSAAIHVQGSISLGSWVTLGTPNQKADDLHLTVAGFDSANRVAAARIGSHSLVAADIAVPHGRLEIADFVHASGAFAAFDVLVGDHSSIEYLNGLTASPAAQQQLTGYFQPPMSTAPVVGQLAADTPIALALSLSPTGGSGALAAQVRAVSDPTSPSFRHYLSQSEFAATYGAPTTTYAALTAWAQAAGFTVNPYANRLVLGLQGTAAAVEAAFHVNLYVAAHSDGTGFFTADRDPSLDTAIPVVAIEGLNDYFASQVKGGGGSGPGGAFTGSEIRQMYAGCTTRTGNGQAVGIVSYYDTYTDSDIASYVSTSNLVSTASITRVVVDKASPLRGEASLDIEMAVAMAPGLNEVVVLEGQVMNSILGELVDHRPLIRQASNSFNWPINQGTQDLVNALACQGQSYSDASGDNGGDATQLNHLANDIDLANITLVGGTEISFNVLHQPLELAWTLSGGGVLNGDLLPYYQAGLATPQNGVSATSRNAPDFAMLASDIFDVAGGKQESVVGTSASSPLWAGFMALVNEQGEANGFGDMGFANPILYQLARSSHYAETFTDIVNGGGYVPGTGTAYAAGRGYDLATGWGRPRCEMIDFLSPPPAQQVTTQINNISATATMYGPYVCASGQGFLRGRALHLSYDGIPGRTAPRAGGVTGVNADGTFSLTDSTFASPGGALVASCSDDQLSAQVTVTASDGVNSSSATLPASLWCGNSHISEVNGGCQ